MQKTYYVFTSDFEKIVLDPHSLMNDLCKIGFIDKDGRVKNKFLELEDVKKFHINFSYNGTEPLIYYTILLKCTDNEEERKEIKTKIDEYKEKIEERKKEIELVIKAQHGDKDAFNVLDKKNREPLKKSLREMLKSYHDAEDITNETFLKAHKYINTFRGDSSFHFWISRIALYLAIDLLRKRKKEGTPIPLEDKTIKDILKHKTYNPLDMLIIKEKIEEIERKLDEKTEKVKKVIKKRFWEGWKNKEIEEEYNLTTNVVKQIISHFRRDINRKKL